MRVQLGLAFRIPGGLRGFAFPAALLLGGLFRRLCGGLLVCDALLLGVALGLCRLACGLGGGQRFVLGGIVEFLAFAIRRPGRKAGESADDVAESNGQQDREYRKACHQHARPERRQETRKASCHQEVADGAARIWDDVERRQDRLYSGGAHSDDLKQAGDGQEEKRHADGTAAWMERVPEHESKATEHACERNGPYAEPQQLVAGVCEPVSGHADQV